MPMNLNGCRERERERERKGEAEDGVPLDGQSTHGQDGGVLNENENGSNEFTRPLIENPVRVRRGDELNKIRQIEHKNEKITRSNTNNQLIGQRSSHSTIKFHGDDHQSIAQNSHDFNQNEHQRQRVTRLARHRVERRPVRTDVECLTGIRPHLKRTDQGSAHLLCSLVTTGNERRERRRLKSCNRHTDKRGKWRRRHSLSLLKPLNIHLPDQHMQRSRSSLHLNH